MYVPIRPAPAALLAALLVAACACSETPAEASRELKRSDRFGIFRDLVLVERPVARGGPFFLDSFETTIDDWLTWRQARGLGPGPGDTPDTRPVASITLHEARQFAAWRFCRLPRADEWLEAATRGDANNYPWGSNWIETFANTHGLRLGRVTPVGSFEGGRSAGGPYDLIGNVAEWTETVDLRVERFPTTVGSVETILPGDPRLEETFGLRCWLPEWAPLPLEWLVQAESEDVPRLVVGGSFLTTISSAQNSVWPSFPLPESWLPGRAGPATGVRLASDPDDLLERLVAHRELPPAAGREMLRQFLHREHHFAVLAPAWERVRPRADGPMAAWLQSELVR